MNDVDTLLEKIRYNCTVLSRYHQKRYLYLKSRLKFYRIPILVLSALGSTDDKVLGLEAGADDYLNKPFDSEVLLMKIKAIIQRKSVDTKTDITKFEFKIK